MGIRWTSKAGTKINNYWSKVFKIEIYLILATFLALIYFFYKIDFQDDWNWKYGVSWKNVLLSENEYRLNRLKLDSWDMSKIISSSTNKYTLIDGNSKDDWKIDDFRNSLYKISNNVGFAIINKSSGDVFTNREWLYKQMNSSGKTTEQILDDLGYVTYYTVDNVNTFNSYIVRNDLLGDYDKKTLSNYKEVYFIRDSYYTSYIRAVQLFFIFIIFLISFLVAMILKIIRYGKRNGKGSLNNIIKSLLIYKYFSRAKRGILFLPSLINKYRVKLFKTIIVLAVAFIALIIIDYKMNSSINRIDYLLISVGIYNFSGNIIRIIRDLLIILVGILLLDRVYKLEELISQTKVLATGNLNNKIEIEDAGDSFGELIDNINSIRDGYEIVLENQLKTEKLKTELITNVSHDLRTPLTSIINYVDILKREDITEEERKDYLEILSNKSYKLKTLIDDLFEISKMSSGKVTLEKNDLDIVELVYQTLGEYIELYEEKELEFRVNAPESLMVSLDGYRMSRVLNNLIINSIKYSMNSTRIYIDIADSSEAIKISFKNVAFYEMNFNNEEIFERFVRGDSSRNSEIDGSGLGLAIARSIVELHNGNMDIETEGDMFKVYIDIPKDI
ncbi:HAMP domain-containing sensor histidine kinase [Clostridium sp. C8-1-8]|uniref:sensor histidine kinase n=1 Tax=Clostridium sp. C8-1-8 TaxID=2698831 RepID=UPI001FACC5B6|nr:HAMP domain-containing sensor histidine kinase [Clostridium sp. C8-1-8]